MDRREAAYRTVEYLAVVLAVGGLLTFAIVWVNGAEKPAAVEEEWTVDLEDIDSDTPAAAPAVSPTKGSVTVTIPAGVVPRLSQALPQVVRDGKAVEPRDQINAVVLQFLAERLAAYDVQLATQARVQKAFQELSGDPK